jgi:type I restriction-modification system DNA methylase subunit
LYVREHHLPLFHPRLVRARMAMLDQSLFGRHKQTVGVWLEHLRSGALDEAKEVSLHGEFLHDVFGDILGYTTFGRAQDGKWELGAEKSVVSGGSADGAIGFFSKGHSRVVAPIELKGATQFLEHAKGRSLTPIQQGWDYANKTPESSWIIVSNYRETRLYSKSSGQAAYELFRLEELDDENGFLRFVALLGRDAMLGGPPAGPSPLADILLASERTEREITTKLYSEYRGIRSRLFEELRQRHSNIPSSDLLAYAQTILDRVLFLAFAEDRQLLPAGTIAHAYQHRDPYNPRPIWQNFVAVFKAVDKGSPPLGIPAYNGGLFRQVDEFEELEVSDEICAAFNDLSAYDFGEDVSVDVLGHIFEQSITDLDQLRREADEQSGPVLASASVGTQKAPSKRQLEGIFYTPPFVTAFLVRETLGYAIADAWQRAQAGRGATKKDRIATWEAYQNELRRIRVLDPACGSGAFLIAAFDALAQEFDRANRALAELRGQQASLFDLTRAVLNENLFGVDKSGESIEITKLSLWLKTAQNNKKLTYLDRNVRQGNSVVSDVRVDPLAFDWGVKPDEFLLPELDPTDRADAVAVDARWHEGFDVVLANPPYVRQELLTAYKDHWKDAFRAFDGAADLFVYFFERSLQQLKPGGRLGFIVSNKWLRGGYAEKLRELFAKECTIDSMVDFGHAPIFPGTDAFPCIITLRKSPPPPDHAVRVTLYPREELGKELLASYVEAHRFPMPQAKLDSAGWTLEPPGVQALLEKLRRNGVPLGEYAPIKPYYGIKTGCNDAFLVDQATKERLCREDPRSAEVLKKYLRGQDIARWSPEWAGLWLVLLKSSGDQSWPWSKTKDSDAAEAIFAESFPALHRYMKPLEATLRKRTDHGRFWWELRSCAYYELFDRPKLVYQEIQFHPAYGLDRTGYFLNNKGFLFENQDPWLLASLNSPAMWWHNWRYLVHLKDEALSPAGDKIVHVPIPRPSAQHMDATAPAVESIVELTRTSAEATAAVLDLLRVEYDVETPGQMLGDFANLGSDAFVHEVKKRRPKKGTPLSPAGLKALRTLFEAEAPGIIEKRARILELERTIATAVHEAYGLTAEDLELLRATQPPRMPQGW